MRFMKLGLKSLSKVRSQWLGTTYHCQTCGRMSIHPVCQAGCPRNS